MPISRDDCMKAIDRLFQERRKAAPHRPVSSIMGDIISTHDITFNEPVNPVIWSTACREYEEKAVKMYERV